MKLLIFALAFLLIGTGAAQAGPIGAAIAAVGSLFSGSAILGAIAKTVLSIGLSKLAQKLLGPKPPKPPGQTVEGMTTGETSGETFIVGLWATGGNLVYHGSFGEGGGTPNVRLVRVIELAGLPGHNLRGVIVKGEHVDLFNVTSETSPQNDPRYTVNGSFGVNTAGFGRRGLNDSLTKPDGNPAFWVRYHDGTQTAADSLLLDRFATAENPYGADRVGAGICYAVVTYGFSPEVWQGGADQPRFVLEGIRLYDPRFDTSVGGSGSQRHNDPATWGRTTNPMVIAYNVARGIPLPGGDIYGGEYQAADLPLARWVAGMNFCDARDYEFGAEINVAETEPAAVIEACIEACSGQIAAVGGSLIPQVGPPDVPVWSITDDDVSAEDGVQFEPIKGLADRYNAGQGIHMSPAQLWEPRNLPLYTNATFEAEDAGRRLIADLPLGGVYSAAQGAGLVEAFVKDGRRQRTHTMVLPPDAARLSLFDTISVTRLQDGYDDKLVEVVGFEQRTDDTFCTVVLREVDPDDYDPPATATPDPPVPVQPPIVAQAVPGFAAVGVSITDGEAEPRRAGIRVTWDFAQCEDVPIIALEFRPVGGDTEIALNVPAESGRHIEALLPAQDYEVRARLVTERRANWTDWEPATTPDVRLSSDDLNDELRENMDMARDLIDGSVETIGGVVGQLRNDLAGAISDLEDADAAIAGSITVLSVSMGTANLIPNGAFSTGASDPGEVPGWSGVPTTFRIEARGGAGNAASTGAPQPFYLRTDSDSVNRSATAAAGIPVTPGDEFRAVLSAAAFGSGAASFDINLQFLDAAGGVIDNNFLSVSASSTTWVRTILPASAPVVAPAGAASLNIIVRRNSGGAARGYIADLRAERVGLAQAEANAAIDTLQAVKVDAAGAVAAVNTVISAEYNDVLALAEATALAQSTVDGILEGFVWSLGGDDVLSLIRVDDGETEPTTAARIKADYILLNGDVEVDGTFKVSNINISGDIESDNYAEDGGVPTDGFRLERDTGLIKGVGFVDRAGLVKGAATDLLSENIPGLFTGIEEWGVPIVVLEMSLGPTEIDEIWTVAVSGFYRISTLGQQLVTLWIERQTVIGGVTSAWGSVSTTEGGGTGFTLARFSENWGGVAEDIRYRMRVRVTNNDEDAPVVGDYFRDFAINAHRIKR